MGKDDACDVAKHDVSAAFAFVDNDPIQPASLRHACEEIFHDGVLEQRYNYLLYVFESGEACVRARAYLDDIATVSIFPAHRTGGSPTDFVVAPELRELVFAYLQRRYARIQELSLTSGYQEIWSRQTG